MTDATGQDNGVTSGATATSATMPDSEPVLDVGAGPPIPTELCGVPVPTECEPTWAPDDDLGLDPWDSSVRPEGTEWVGIDLVSSQSGRPQWLWALQADVPCWELPRTSTVAYLDLSEHAGWEYTLIGTYRVGVDIELLNGCVHVQLHELSVHETEPDDAPPTDLEALVPNGLGYAAVRAGD